MELEKFPFGKYKGKTIDEIPCTYLAYAIENFDLPEDYVNKMRIEVYNRLNIKYATWDYYEAARELTVQKLRDNKEEGGDCSRSNILNMVIDNFMYEMIVLINPNDAIE